MPDSGESRSSELPPSARTQQLPELTQGPTDPTVLAMGKLARAAGTRSASRPEATLHQHLIPNFENFKIKFNYLEQFKM